MKEVTLPLTTILGVLKAARAKIYSAKFNQCTCGSGLLEKMPPPAMGGGPRRFDRRLHICEKDGGALVRFCLDIFSICLRQ